MPLDAIPGQPVDTPPQDVGAPRSHPQPSGSRAGWCVVSTKPKAEHRALTHLTEQHFDAYLPLYRHAAGLRPLFPSYLFLHLTPHTAWRPVLNTPGVHDLLRSADGIPHIARPGVIEALQAGEAIRRIQQPPGAAWRPGASCRLTGGGLAGHDGVVLEVGKHTAIVAMLLFGAIREVNVSLDAITARD